MQQLSRYHLDMTKSLIVATRNHHKVEEIRAMLPHANVCDLSAVPDAPHVEETGSTFLENATLKALAISALTEELVLADDSGLEVDCLNGEPGVYSSRYAGEDGNDDLNNKKLLQELEGQEDRGARFRCVLVLAQKGEVLADFSGAVEGRILTKRSGEGGFGYDPLFAPEGSCESFAELGEDVKNSMSHRAEALNKMNSWITEFLK